MEFDRIAKLGEQYTQWKQSLLLTSDWVPIPHAFKNQHLRELNPNALKVYLYFCLNADPKSGESRHSVKKIADYFGNTERAITAWIKELQQYGLIERLHIVANTEAHTFVLPLTPVTGDDHSAPNWIIEPEYNTAPPVPIPLRLAERRRQQGLTLAQLSERTGIRVRYLSQLERGCKVNPELNQLERLAKGLGIPITALLALLEAKA